MRVNPIVATCLILGLLATPCQATTIITIVDRNRILIGADSLWFGVNGSKTRASTRCKIETPKPTCAFAITGLQIKPETHFDAAVFARRACELEGSPPFRQSAPASMAAIAAAFGDSIREPLKIALERFKRDSPIRYKLDFPGKPAIEVIFVGFRDGHSSAAMKRFNVGMDGNLSDEALIEIPNGSITRSGEHAAADLYLSHNQNRPSDPALIRALIQTEIAEQPTFVGPPISILEITQGGQTWVDPGKCSTEINH